MVDKQLMSSASAEWCTPPWLVDILEMEFGRFELDAAATDENAICPLYYTRETDALVRPWTGRTWVNPPYGRGRKGLDWANKMLRESLEVHRPEILVGLVPARTDTRAWHDVFFRYCAEIRFIKGRLKFIGPDGESENSAPFPSALVIFKPRLSLVSYGSPRLTTMTQK